MHRHRFVYKCFRSFSTPSLVLFFLSSNMKQILHFMQVQIQTISCPVMIQKVLTPTSFQRLFLAFITWCPFLSRASIWSLRLLISSFIAATSASKAIAFFFVPPNTLVENERTKSALMRVLHYYATLIRLEAHVAVYGAIPFGNKKCVTTRTTERQRKRRNGDCWNVEKTMAVFARTVKVMIFEQYLLSECEHGQWCNIEGKTRAG